MTILDGMLAARTVTAAAGITDVVTTCATAATSRKIVRTAIHAGTAIRMGISDDPRLGLRRAGLGLSR